MSIVDEISQQLFSIFRESVPLPSAAQSRKIKHEEIMLSLGKFNDEARALRRTHRLGVLARARIILSLQRQFVAAGYPADMSRDVLFSLILSAFVGKV